MKNINIYLLLIIISSCAHVPNESKKLIIVDDVKYVSYCTKVGVVYADSSFSGSVIWTMAGNSNSLTKMKNMAAKMGDVLLITKNKESMITGSEREGWVYKCPPNIVFKQVEKS